MINTSSGMRIDICTHDSGLPGQVDSVLHTIGHTPLVRLRRLVEPGMAEVVVKLEYFTPTGSYKDRLALAMVCAMKGYTFHSLSSDAFSAEKLDTMRAFGADLEIVQRDGGKVTAAWVASCSSRWAASMNSWG